jgi:hypothetical protein
MLQISASRPALGLTQPPVQWVPGALCPGVKRDRGVMLTTHPLLVPRSSKCRSYTSCHPDAPLWIVTGPLYIFLYLPYCKWLTPFSHKFMGWNSRRRFTRSFREKNRLNISSNTHLMQAELLLVLLRILIKESKYRSTCADTRGSSTQDFLKRWTGHGGHKRGHLDHLTYIPHFSYSQV